MAPRYRLKLSKLDFISAVDTPAQETATALLIKRGAKDDIALTARAIKINDELGLVFGWAFTSQVDGAPYHDLQGDAIDEEFVKAAMDFMIDGGGASDEMHDSNPTGRVVFAMPLTAEIAKSFGIQTDTTGLMVAIKPSAAVLQKFKSGELTGFSIAGAGERVLVGKGVWSTSTVDDFPDSSFLYIGTGGKKDDQGKTTPRSLRMFPIKDENGKIDIDHLRDAISRIPQSSLPATLRNKIQVKAEKLLAAQHAKDTSKSVIGKKEPMGKCADCGEPMPVDAKMCPDCGGKQATKRAPISKQAMLTTATDGHVHMLDDSDNGGASGETDWRPMPDEVDGGFHSHPWVRSSDGTIVIGEAENHTHLVLTPDAIDEIVESNLPPDDDEDDVGMGKRARKSTPLGAARSVAVMPTEHELKIVELTKRAERAEKLATLTDAHKAHYGKLPADQRDAFVAKSTADRDAEIAATRGTEVYKSVRLGRTFYTTDDPLLAQMAKDADEQHIELAKSRLHALEVDLEKRATSALTHFEKSVAIDLVRAVETQYAGDAEKDRREKVLTALKGMNALFMQAGTPRGTNPGDDASGGVVSLGLFNKKLGEFAKSINKTPANATAEFLKTAEGSELYAQLNTTVFAKQNLALS
jgi:Putative phage serine protease XkdF